jgi:hypothetical protein
MENKTVELIQLQQTTLNALVSYLASKPYSEVAKLMQTIGQDVQQDQQRKEGYKNSPKEVTEIKSA